MRSNGWFKKINKNEKQQYQVNTLTKRKRKKENIFASFETVFRINKI